MITDDRKESCFHKIADDRRADCSHPFRSAEMSNVQARCACGKIAANSMAELALFAPIGWKMQQAGCLQSVVELNFRQQKIKLAARGQNGI